MQELKKRIWTFLAPILAVLGMACTALNPATAPAPLAELPASLSFPDDVAIDVSETNVVGGGATLKFLADDGGFKPQVLPVGGEYFDGIVFGFTVNNFVNTQVELFLTSLSTLSIPFNPITVFFDSQNILPDQRLKIDLSPFDYDGDGVDEACTGCSCPTGCDSVCPSEAPFEDLRPVCYRIWRDAALNGEFVPFMAGIFEQLNIPDDPETPEDEGNPGVGTFRLSISLFIVPGDPPVGVTNLGVDYNHRNPARPLDLITEYYTLFQSIFFTPDSNVAYVRTEQNALDDTDPSEDRLLKTIRYSNNQVNSDGTPVEPPSTLQYVARYRTDFNFWSGTLQNFTLFPQNALVPPPPIENFFAVCAELSTAVEVAQSTCLDIDIDVTNVPFLELLLPDDARVNLPADFPPTPTF